jgi:hypothetical protein
MGISLPMALLFQLAEILPLLQAVLALYCGRMVNAVFRLADSILQESQQPFVLEKLLLATPAQFHVSPCRLIMLPLQKKIVPQPY